MDYYKRVKQAFARGILGCFVPKTDKDAIEKLINDGYLILYMRDDSMNVVKVINPYGKNKNIWGEK